jgi:predicted nuclease of restriction endonuclease-like RecB superfamily
MKNESIYDRMSRAEKEVADVLKELKIQWTYEQPVFIWDENKRPRVWTPDFYLTQFGVYVEVCGSQRFEYEYRKKIYDKNGYDVIFLQLFKKSTQWKAHFIRYLRLFTNKRNHKLHEIFNEEKKNYLFIDVNTPY